MIKTMYAQDMQPTAFFHLLYCERDRGGWQLLLNSFKEGKMKKYGCFHATKLLKSVFPSSFKKYILCKGLYDHFSTEKMSAWKYISPWTPKVALPPQKKKKKTIYPDTAPACDKPEDPNNRFVAFI